MSWIADLAGRAESLLNNIDQSAAGAIKSNETLSSFASPAPIQAAQSKNEPPISYRHSIAEMDYTKSPSVAQKYASSKPTRKPSLTKLDGAVKHVKTKAAKDSDEALFDFLNSSGKAAPRKTQSHTTKQGIRKSGSSTSVASTASLPSAEKKEPPKPAPPKQEPQTLQAPPLAPFHISRSSSIDSVNSKNTAGKSPNDNGSTSSEANDPSSEADLVSYPMDSTASESEFEMVSNAAVSSVAASEHDSGEEMGEANSRKVQSLQMENRMLQNEISALHQEMKSLSDRSIRNKGDMERRISELQRKYDDMTQQFDVKNSQVEAMHIEVNDLMQENNALKRSIQNLQTERERIIDDQTAGSGMHAQALEQLRSRLEESESSLIRERDISRTLKEDALREREKQDADKRKLAESLRKCERERQAEKKRLDEALLEVNSLQTNLASSRHELSDYKQKASRILQSKERLINSLKGGIEVDLSPSASASIELDEVKQERDSLKEELMSSRAELVQVRNDFQDMEGQYQQEQSILQEEVEELRRNMEEESGCRREAEADVARFEQELRREREEATRARAATNERLQDKEEEIGKLRSQLMMRSRSAPDETELESRLKQLTEALIQKQTMVETLSTEKSSLVLQLERAEGQIKRLSQEHSSQMTGTVNDGGEAASSHHRNGGQASMFHFSGGSERGVVGQVRKAASAVDRFSVRLGVFLRRYPVARLFVIVYMGLLHFWVMIVLLTYSPEIHGHDYGLNLGDGKVEHHAAHGLPDDG